MLADTVRESFRCMVCDREMYMFSILCEDCNYRLKRNEVGFGAS